MSYGQGRVHGRESQEARTARDERVAAIATEAAASAAASAIQQIRIVNTTIQRRVEREVQVNTVYRDCAHPPGVRDDINRALTGREPDTAAGAGLSAAGAARR